MIAGIVSGTIALLWYVQQICVCVRERVRCMGKVFVNTKAGRVCTVVNDMSA